MQQPKVELRVHSMLSVSCSHTIWMCIQHHSWCLLTWIIHLYYVVLYCLLLHHPSAKFIGRLHPLLEHHQLRKTPHSKQQKVKALEACVEEKASIDKLQSCQCQAHLVLADTSALRVHNVKLLDIDATSALQDAQVAWHKMTYTGLLCSLVCCMLDYMRCKYSVV